jgi:CRP/FNR family transcriptional regulator, cyclic AMP receptor protein
MAKTGIDALAGTRIFGGLPKSHLRRILKATERYTYAAGAAVVQEGKASEAFFVVLDGTAKVVRRGRTVNRLRAGDTFGEIALLDGGPRTASVVADGPLTCLVLLRKEFRTVLSEEPKVAYEVLKGTAGMLRRADRSLTP